MEHLSFKSCACASALKIYCHAKNMKKKKGKSKYFVSRSETMTQVKNCTLTFIQNQRSSTEMVCLQESSGAINYINFWIFSSAKARFKNIISMYKQKFETYAAHQIKFCFYQALSNFCISLIILAKIFNLLSIQLI